ncbi:MAG TPA: hypothetical protein VE988_09225, partial [Gemmataceae bacterium]|nr:hypothetical protein [Gemmataceae bacterium]
MNDMHDNDLVRWLDQLGDVKPAAEATRRAVDRTRDALIAAPPISLAATSKLSTTSIGVMASVLLVAVGLTGWLLLSPGDGPRTGLTANGPASVCYRQTTRTGGEPAVSILLQIRTDGAWRADKSDGSYTVFDVAKHQALFVNQAKREAVLRNDVSGPQLTLYEAVKDLPNDPSARPLPARKIDGQDVIGFVAKAQGQDVTIWVDAHTLLLVRVECDWKNNDGKLATVVLDQFEFGK